MYDDYSLTDTLWLTGVNIVSYKIINTKNIFQWNNDHNDDLKQYKCHLRKKGKLWCFNCYS